MTNTKVVRAVTIEKSILNAFEPLKESSSSFGTIEFEGIARVEVLEGALRWVVTTISTITTITTITTIVAIGGTISLSELCKNSSNVGIGVGRGSTTRRHSTDFHKTRKDIEDRVSITRKSSELIENGRKGSRQRCGWLPTFSAAILFKPESPVALVRI
ncbi:hypothetical protein L1987_70961 [Smallanthus sonchifolius]|uniref:Uncharacterized protein n=1 Tax=Smallanthus sonchifolius TaxID=185202 RepID=A0ACB9AVE8_9ASTR|nr:hypothetical protein L1987_70961 [Smallanthus sonchifolius]